MNSSKEPTIQDTINEEEILNQAILAYTLGYPWEVQASLLSQLSSDFFKQLINELINSGVIVRSELLNRFEKPIKTRIVFPKGNARMYEHTTLVDSYIFSLDKYRRGFTE